LLDNIKEYLSQIYYLDKMIDAKIKQSERFKELALRVALVLTQDKVSGGALNPDKTSNYICTWIDLDKEISEDIDRLIDLKKEIEAVINRVSNPRYKLLLTLRYINCMKWEEIAEEMNYSSLRWLHQLHKKALYSTKKH